MHQKFTTNDLNNLIRLLQCPLLPSLLRNFCRTLCSRLTYICNPNTLERVSLNMIGILIQRSSSTYELLFGSISYEHISWFWYFRLHRILCCGSLLIKRFSILARHIYLWRTHKKWFDIYQTQLPPIKDTLNATLLH